MQDLRYAIRSLRATPIVTAVAILSLTLGIGANAALFSLVDGLLLRPLPVRAPDRLVLVVPADREIGSFTYATWQELRARRTLFDKVFAWRGGRVNLAERGPVEMLDAIWVSGPFFEGLGISPILGRALTEQDHRDGGPDGPVAVISYGLWRRRFGGAADVIGQPLRVNRVRFTIVGVAPPGFFGLDVGGTFDVILPDEAESTVAGRDVRFGPYVQVMGRLRPDRSAETVTAALRAAQPQIREAAMPPYELAYYRDAFLRAPLTARPAPTGSSGVRGRYGRPLVTVLGIAAAVLLIACANVANVLIARGAMRRREIGIRLAIGASRLRVARQLLTESLLLAGAGAAAGLLLARWAGPFLVQQLSIPNYTVFLDLTLNWRVIGFTMLVAVATALLFGIAPAFSAGRVDAIEVINDQRRGIAGDARRLLGGALTAVQIALALTLLVGAGLFIRTFSALEGMPLGLEADRVLTISVNPERSALSHAERVALYGRLQEAATSVPGVESAAASITTPLSGLAMTTSIELAGKSTGPETDPFTNHVTPEWFRTFGTPVLAGRDFTAADGPGAPAVAIVNRAFVRRFMNNGESPLGATVWRSRPRQPLTVIGVIEDAIYRMVREAPPPTMYLPAAQLDESVERPMWMMVSVRARRSSNSEGGSSVPLVRGLAEALARVDPALVLTFQPLGAQVDAAFARERVVAMLSAFFSGLALLLAALGVYGITHFAVTRRRAEIAVRMALGAAPAAVTWMVLRRTIVVVAVGTLAGSALSLWMARLIEALLYGVQPRDVSTFIGAAGILALVGLVSAWLPARRAARIDPATVLREI